MLDVVRIGVIGVGAMGARHVETLERLDTAELVAVADPDRERAAGVIGRRPVAWHEDLSELLARDDLDAVCVATPSFSHAEIVLEALEAGLHVLVEKPIATELPDALRMAAAAVARSRKLMVGHVERFNPAVGKVRELLNDGRLGRVYRAQATRVGSLPPRITDAGVAIDLATHDLDIMQHVLGRDITRAYAEGSRFRHDRHEDMLTCLLRFGEDGPFGVLDANWLTAEKRRELTLIGEGGTLRANYITQDVFFVEADSTSAPGWEELALVRGDAEGALVRFALHKEEPLRAELAAFCACVLDDTPEPVDAWDGARALVAALAVRDSAVSGRPVTLLDMPRRPRSATS
jgi:UDP-N-acetylglucosamine 3-dehydrogenase